MQSLLCKPINQWRAYRCIISVSFTQIKSTEMQTTKAQHAIDPHVPQLDPKSCGEQMVQAGPKIWITVLDFSEVHPLHFRKERLNPVKFKTILYAGKQQIAPNKAASHSCGQNSCILGALYGHCSLASATRGVCLEEMSGTPVSIRAGGWYKAPACCCASPQKQLLSIET